MRFGGSRLRLSYPLAVIGSCLGVYVVIAVAFNWLIEPTVAKNRGPGPDDAAPARIVQAPVVPVTPSARVEPPSRAAAKPGTPAQKSVETARAEAPRVATKLPTPAPIAATPPVAAAPSVAASAPVATSAPVAAAASAPVAVAAPVAAETARAELPAGVASEAPATATAAAAEPTEAAPPPPAPKKKKVARSNRNERQKRDYWNPFRFFASGPSNGSRPWF